MSVANITDSSVAFSLTIDNRQVVQSLIQTEGQMKDFVDNSENYIGQFGKSFHNILLGTAAELSGFFQTAKSTLTSLFDSFASYGDEMAKMAQRTGITAQSLSEFKYIAGQCGTSIEAVETAIRAMQRTMYDASRGSGELKAAYDSIGVSLDVFRAQAPDEQFRTLAQAIAAVEDPVQRNAVAMKLFGDSGTQLMALFNSGPDGMDRLAQTARELGLVMSDEDYVAAENLTDAMDNLKQGFEGVQRQLVTGLSPTMTAWSNTVANAMKQIISFTKEHQTLTTIIAGVMIFITTMTGGIYGIAKAYQIAAAAQALFTAHPAAIVITAAAAATIGLVTALNSASDATAKLSHEMEELSKKHKEARDTDKDYFAKLEELTQKQNKTSEDIQKATFYADALNAAYGGLGITVDSTTGKISGLSEAFKKMNEAQRAQRIADTKAEILEQKQNLDKIESDVSEWLNPTNEVSGYALEEERRTGTVVEDKRTGKNYSTVGAMELYPGRRKKIAKDIQNKLEEIETIEDQIKSREQIVSGLEKGFDVEEAKEEASGAACSTGGAAGTQTKDFADSLREKLANKTKKDELTTLDEESAAEIARLQEQLDQTTENGEREQIQKRIDEIKALSSALKEVLLAETDAAKGLEKFWSKFDEENKPDFDAELGAISGRASADGADTFSLIRQQKATERAKEESAQIAAEEESLKKRLHSGKISEEKYRTESDELNQRKEKAAGYDKQVASLTKKMAEFEMTIEKRGEELKTAGLTDDEIETEKQTARSKFGEKTNEQIGQVRVRQASELTQRDEEQQKRISETAVSAEQREINDLTAQITEQEQLRDNALRNAANDENGKNREMNQKDYEDAAKEIVILTKNRDDKVDVYNAQQLREASERFNTAAKTLEETQKTGDANAIGNANKEYNDAQTNLEKLRSVITPTMQDSIEEAVKIFGESFDPSAISEEFANNLDQINPEKAVEEIENGVAESEKFESVGTFSAFESSKLGNDYNQKIYENSRAQVRYLRDIVNNTKSAASAAVFA